MDLSHTTIKCCTIAIVSFFWENKKWDFKSLFFVLSVGKPIPVIKTENPTEEQIEEVHSAYVQALKELYEEYNPIYGDPKIQLNFIWIKKQANF